MLFIISIIALIIGILLIQNGIDNEVFWRQLFGFILIAASLILIISATCPDYKPTPQAIDVYRGKTTLQITYQDSIPIDSIVIFK